MKGLSCNSNLLCEMPVVEAIDVLAEEGYQAVDVCMEIAPPFVPIPTPHMTPDDDSATRKRVRKRAEDAGIAFGAINAHTDISVRDPEIRKANTKFLQGSIEIAADLGADIVVTAAGGKACYGYEKWFFEWAEDTLRQVLPTADRLGITLAIEAGSPPGSTVYNLKTMQRLLQGEGLGNLRVLFDPAHYHMRGDDVTHVFETLGEQIVHMHAKDATGNPENLIFPPLGEGEINFDTLFGAMSARGYDGYIAMEYEAFAWGFERDPRTVLRKSKAFLDELVQKHWKE